MSDKWVIVCQGLVGYADREPDFNPTGLYLAAYDPEAHNGRGHATWTGNRGDAMEFDSAVAAVACWRQVPSNRKRRPDGKWNRPLTAFSVEVVKR